ncbi:MAG: HAD family phosphatase [Deltaproteobacteria bacterium]|nr:HAD family phosphatase [Deltaproteobacteria bacterium]MBW2496835.1 HAD family phosphatase [Deltaproteobacteria bacterium]
MSPSPPRAVLFDLGGVVLGSPLDAIREYESELGYHRNAINHVVAETSPDGAWSRLERGELDLPSFYGEFEADCLAAGLRIDAREMMERMSSASAPRHEMLEAIRRLRDAGLKVGALTNNWSHTKPSGASDGTRAVRTHFDVFIESSVVGLRKPDPRIYALACELLETVAEAVVFLDDIGHNLKPARALGMTTIKVESAQPALRELEAHLGIPLLA